MRGPGNTCLAEILVRGGELYVQNMRLQLEEMRQTILPIRTGISRLMECTNVYYDYY